jgi:hypothetical protein
VKDSGIGREGTFVNDNLVTCTCNTLINRSADEYLKSMSDLMYRTDINLRLKDLVFLNSDVKNNFFIKFNCISVCMKKCSSDFTQRRDLRRCSVSVIPKHCITGTLRKDSLPAL